MDELNNFENNLRKKLEAQDFPFDEKNWEKARVMIDDSRKKKKRRFFLLWMLAGISVATALLLALISLGDEQRTTFPKETNQLSVNDKTMDQVPVNKPTPSTTDQISNTDSQQNPGEKNEKENGIAYEKQLLEAKQIEGKKEQKTESAPEIKSSNSKVTKQKGKLNDDLTKPEDTYNNSTGVITSAGTKNNISDKKQKKGKNTLSTAVVQNTFDHNETTKGENTSDKDSEKKDVRSDKTNTTLPMTKGTTPGDSSNKETVKSDSIKPELVLASTPKDSIPKVDSTKKEITAAETKKDSLSSSEKSEDKSSEDHPKNIIYAELGATYFPGWVEDGPAEDGKGFSPVIGLHYTRNLIGKIGAGIGIQYNPIHNMTSVVSSSVSTYDFGVSHDITYVNYKTLYYVSLPIRFNFNISQSDIIGLGVCPSYLLTTKSEVTRETSSDLSPQASLTESSMEKGYTKGFQTYDAQASLFYRRRILKNFSVKAELLCGLVNVKDNSHFIDKESAIGYMQNARTRTHGFKLTLCYDFFKK